MTLKPYSWESGATFDYPDKTSGGYEGTISFYSYAQDRNSYSYEEGYSYALYKCIFTYQRKDATGANIGSYGTATVYFWSMKSEISCRISIPGIPQNECLQISNLKVSSWDGSSTYTFTAASTANGIINNSQQNIYFYSSN